MVSRKDGIIPEEHYPIIQEDLYIPVQAVKVQDGMESTVFLGDEELGWIEASGLK